MADIEKVKTDDIIRIDAVVVNKSNTRRYPVQVDGISSGPVWLLGPVVEAAEHIPAPQRPFKRRDLVSLKGGSAQRTGGIVLHEIKGDPPNESRILEVGWPDGCIQSYVAKDLQHDE